MCLVTDSPEAWHHENLARNPAHYSSLLRVGWPRNFLQTMREMRNFVKYRNDSTKFSLMQLNKQWKLIENFHFHP
jgi:hypothetical protein